MDETTAPGAADAGERPPAQRVSGIGGVFFKARDPVGLAAWYRERLGLPIAEGMMHAVFAGAPAAESEAPPTTVWSTFPAKTGYFGPGMTTHMINYRVADLDAMLAQLRSAGVPVDERIDESEFGRFGWATDPEGNRFELWEPPARGIPPGPG